MLHRSELIEKQQHLTVSDNNNKRIIMLVSTTEVMEGLVTFCLTDDDGNEYTYLRDIAADSIEPVVGYSKLGDNGIRILTEENQYEITYS